MESVSEWIEMVDNTNIMRRGYTYNGLTGKFQRDIINNDIQNISGRVAGAGADIVIATGDAPSNQDIYPYSISLGTPGAVTFAIVNNGSTIGYEYFSSAGDKTITLDNDSPLCRVTTGNTFEIIAMSAVSGSTYVAWAACKRVPTDSYIEP